MCLGLLTLPGCFHFCWFEWWWCGGGLFFCIDEKLSFLLFCILFCISFPSLGCWVAGLLGRWVAGLLGLKIFQSSNHFFVPFVCDGSCCSGSDELCG